MTAIMEFLPAYLLHCQIPAEVRKLYCFLAFIDLLSLLFEHYPQDCYFLSFSLVTVVPGFPLFFVCLGIEKRAGY